MPLASYQPFLTIIFRELVRKSWQDMVFGNFPAKHTPAFIRDACASISWKETPKDQAWKEPSAHWDRGQDSAFICENSFLCGCGYKTA